MKNIIIDSDAHDILLTYLEEAAEFRSLKAKEYPDDERNENSARRLREIAQQLSAMDPSDPLIVAYEKAKDAVVEASNDNNVLAIDEAFEEENRQISRIGFDRGHQKEDISSVLESLIRHWNFSLDEVRAANV